MRSTKGDHRAPLQFALEENLVFPIGANLYLSPVTESFRRHMIIGKDEEGRIIFAHEKMIAGEDKDTQLVWAQSGLSLRTRSWMLSRGGEIAWRLFLPENCRTALMSYINTEFIFDRECPLRIVGFEYRWMGKGRFPRYQRPEYRWEQGSGVADGKQLEKEIIRQIADRTAATHASCKLWSATRGIPSQD